MLDTNLHSRELRVPNELCGVKQELKVVCRKEGNKRKFLRLIKKLLFNLKTLFKTTHKKLAKKPTKEFPTLLEKFSLSQCFLSIEDKEAESSTSLFHTSDNPILSLLITFQLKQSFKSLHFQENLKKLY